MESLSRAGQEMSLAALKQHDPYITSIADLTGQVALYTFCPKANQWEKTDIEGTLFVYRSVVEEETRRSQQAARDKQSPSQANGCSEHRPIDILEMLSRAKDEYERSAPSGHKHLTVEELFGTSLPREQPAVVGLDSEEVEKLPGDASQKEPGSFLPFPFERSGGAPQPESLGVHPAAHHSVQPEVTAPVLITPASIAQSSEKHAPSYTVPLSPVLSPTLPAEAPAAQVPPSLPRNSAMMQVKATPRQRSPLLNQPVPDLSHTGLMARHSPFRSPLSVTNSAGTSLPSIDLLQKLRLTPQHDQIQTQPPGKGAAATSFPPAAGLLATPESFIEPPAKTAATRAAATASLSNMVLAPLQVAGSPLVTTATTAVSSVLLSPSVFQQTVSRSTDFERKAKSPSPLTVRTPENQRKPSIVLSKSQLQDTLIHLIKNDSSFLSTLHEVYLQVLTKSKDNHNL
ncbi:mRNA-decapping enzyme 1A [Tupaia chinensis]|uniref:5'-(N(7)-methylguanosine 5'-triphospho)-[mRNA] hydrolase n=1 Tax=Tupaia chinensis TaxID=246437 RepID=L8Y7M7_TUPCH|nr:mRNA-decapping enzyme 1A [Tupaia chinensis]